MDDNGSGGNRVTECHHDADDDAAPRITTASTATAATATAAAE